MPAAPTRLLLIDDDRMQYRLVAEAVRGFRRGNYQVEWAPTCQQGLAQLLTGGYQACLLDYGLPDGDGLGLLAEARRRGNTTPVIFLTATDDPVVDEAALEAGAQDYLVKGAVTPALLERSLRYTLRLAETLDQLRELATHDQLTGVGNRREFTRVLKEEWERTLRYGPELSLVLFDVDAFKAINDRHGHQAGDEALRWIARLLRSNTRNVDRTFRFGGDEFACLLIETPGIPAILVARRLVETIAATPIPLAGVEQSLRATVSAGVATVDPAMKSVDDLLKAADAALYAAKRNGRNQAAAWSTVRDLPAGT